MYIRWKTKPRTKQKWGYHDKSYWHAEPVVHSTLLCAYLVESKRVDGKPRQKTTYLGCIQDQYIDAPYRQLHFWQSTQKNIAPLTLTADQVAMVKAKLLERVPIPTKEQLEESDRQYAKTISAVKESLKAKM